MIGEATASTAGFAETAITVLMAGAGFVVALFAGYNLSLAAAALLARDPPGAPRPRRRLVVLVPAHDEATQIERCVQSLQAQSYPSDLYQIVVVADNCTDDTAALAGAAGADVLVRDEPSARGKGRALRWGMERVLAGSSTPDAVVVVDADSQADPELLAGLVGRFEAGVDAVQGESLLLPNDSPQAALRATAFLLVNRVRPRGRAVLGAPSTLAGNGMLLSSALLRDYPWDAYTSAEDLEYSVDLRLRGVKPGFAGGAIVYSDAAPSTRAATEQQLRWEGGKLHVARTRIPALIATAVRSRRPSLFETVFELAVPPLGLLGAAAAAGAVASALLVWVDVVAAWVLALWLLALLAIPVYVLLGLYAARAPWWAYRSLLRAPLFVLAKVVRARRAIGFSADVWVRTERAAEANPPDETAP